MTKRRRDEYGFDVIPNDEDTQYERGCKRGRKIIPQKESERILDVMSFATPEERDRWNKAWEERCALEQEYKKKVEKAHEPQTKIGDVIYCTYCGRATTRSEFHGDHILFSKARRCEPCKKDKQPRPIDLFCRCCGVVIPKNDNKDSLCAWMCVSCKSK